MRVQRDLTMFGYSSSSESEDERPRKSTIPSSNSQEKKKKKKRKPTPQQSINKTWRHFSAKKFTRVLSILPFDPVPLPTIAERPNESLTASFERAAEECSRKVRKIIQECRRVNTRYRDPGWDIDFDLKFSRGNCLNYLGSNKFDLSGPRLSSSTAVPKAVKRVHEIFEKPSFMGNVDGSDVKQGILGNCWFIASLSALANVQDGIKRLCVEYDTRIGIYGFVFWRDGEWVYSIIDDKLYLTSPLWDSPSMQRDLLQQIDRESEDAETVYRKMYQTGSKSLFFGSNKDQNETWLPLIEKAYAKVHGDFSSLSGGWIGEGVEDLSGGVTTELLTSDILDTDGFWEDEISKVNEEFIFGCSTGLLDGGYGERNGIREGHAYVVMDARTLKNGQRLVKLRNPWGKLKKGIWDGAWSDGSKEWTSDVKEELGHSFGNDSVFWIKYEDMLRKYSHIDRTRLFRSPDWRCCQRWIGVEVPWKAEFHEKFHVTLTKESPLVLVLSQLDNRFYRGLWGQYRFHLHFRLHEQGKPDAEDYIVRSHGNYLMDRSVSIELPCMSPGKYSIFVKAVGERDADYTTVEDVVKRECKQRENHEKLASAGYAYDLAHAKGVAHLEQVAKLRKDSDRTKASASRRAERRRLWEKRHLNREITRKQQKKNQKKRDARRAAEEAEAKRKEVEEAAEKKKREKEEEAERKRKGDLGPQDKASQTDKEELSKGDDKSVQTENPEPSGKSVQTGDDGDGESASSSESSGSPQDTPKTVDAELAKDEDDNDKNTEDSNDEKHEDSKDKKPSKQRGSVGPPPLPPRHAGAYSSDNDSSDSPIDDWEELYSSDDMSKKPRMLVPVPPPLTQTGDKVAETDEEAGLPDPWNAVAIVGLRVYSKDESLDLRVVIEGGALAEGGMGEKGQPDIDDAQTNAAGDREKSAQGGREEEVEIVGGEAVVRRKVRVGGDGDDKEGGEKDGDGNDADEETEKEKETETETEDRQDADHEDSDSVDTPLPTPSETGSGDCTPQRGFE